MDMLNRQVGRARRRLTSELFFSYLSWSLLITLSIAVVGIVIPKLWYVSIDTSIWTVAWLASCSLCALIFALFMTALHRPTKLIAAIEIDRRYGLRERLSSSLQLTAYDRETSVGQALIGDAIQKTERIDVRDRFPIGFSRRMLWSFVPLAMGVAGLLIPDATMPEPVAAKESKIAVSQVSNSVKPLIEQIRKKREEAEDKGLSEVADMFKNLESELDKLQKDSKIDQKNALVKLNDIKKQMEQRRDELGSGQSLQKNLKNLKDLDKGPAEKLAKAMKDGDFEKASDELEQMLEAMKSGQMSPEQEKALATQMEELEKALEEAIENHEQAKSKLEQQIAQAEQAGDTQKTAELRKQLAEMQAMDAQMQQLAEMSSQMESLQKALASGDKQAAQKALEKIQSQMENMKMNADELRELQEMMDQLSDSKNQMNCSNCNGMGCSQCQGNGGKMSNKMGNGMGQGRGYGERPEEESNTSLFDSQVRDQMRVGETISGGKVNGANRKGTTREEVKESILNSKPEDAEALESISLPKSQRDQTREYFDSLRVGK